MPDGGMCYKFKVVAVDIAVSGAVLSKFGSRNTEFGYTRVSNIGAAGYTTGNSDKRVKSPTEYLLVLSYCPSPHCVSRYNSTTQSIIALGSSFQPSTSSDKMIPTLVLLAALLEPALCGNHLIPIWSSTAIEGITDGTTECATGNQPQSIGDCEHVVNLFRPKVGNGSITVPRGACLPQTDGTCWGELCNLSTEEDAVLDRTVLHSRLNHQLMSKCMNRNSTSQHYGTWTSGGRTNRVSFTLRENWNYDSTYVGDVTDANPALAEGSGFNSKKQSLHQRTSNACDDYISDLNPGTECYQVIEKFSQLNPAGVALPPNHCIGESVGKCYGDACNHQSNTQIVFGANIARDMRAQIYDPCIVNRRYGSSESNAFSIKIYFNPREDVPAPGVRPEDPKDHPKHHQERSSTSWKRKEIKVANDRSKCDMVPEAPAPVFTDCYSVMSALFEYQNGTLLINPEECLAAAVNTCSGFICSNGGITTKVDDSTLKWNMVVEIQTKCVINERYGSYSDGKVNTGLYPAMHVAPHTFPAKRMSVEELLGMYNGTSNVITSVRKALGKE
ncbi:hypothetical protein QBC35DRAFT_469363 [Podospora australis]|uniref:Uncharacterized protein n=1 Tax=Podospora australis TaxID=1536484 RepID=A0AAN6X2U2_9PEZI|nr:hypothetical protein QBC35DRAFT_469363 [Podospora australis]